MWGIHYSNNNNNTSNITIQLNRNSSGETYSCYDVVVAVVVVSRRLFTVLRVCVHDSLEWQQLVANSVRGLPHTYTYITKSVSMFLPRLYEVKSNLGGLDDGADWRIYNIGISRMQMKTFRARRADTGATVLVLWVVLLTHTHAHQHSHHHVNQVCVENQFSNPPQAATIGFVFEVIWQQNEKLHKTRAN